MDFTKIKDHHSRILALALMDILLRNELCPDEDVFEDWLTNGIPDEEAWIFFKTGDPGLLTFIAEEDESYLAICNLFTELVNECR